MPAEIQVFPTTALGDNTHLLSVGRMPRWSTGSGTPGGSEPPPSRKGVYHGSPTRRGRKDSGTGPSR